MTTAEFQSLSRGAVLATDDEGVSIVAALYYQGSEWRADVEMTIAFQPMIVRGLTAFDLRDYHVTGAGITL